MQSSWKFDIPENKLIPTELRIKKGGVLVCYRRCTDEFAYIFEIYNNKRKSAESILKEIVRLMVAQSNNTVLEWKHISTEKIDTEYVDNRYKVKFKTIAR